MIHPTAIIDPGAWIGTDCFIWHYCHVMSGAQLGNRCMLGQNCFVADGVCIGDGCRIQNNVSLYDGVTLEGDVFVGPSAVFTNVRMPRATISIASKDYGKTLVCRGASIGANATIVCPCTIGQGALVGAGSVVTGHVPAFAIVSGVPATVRGWICACGQKLSSQPQLHETSFICQACQRRYIRRVHPTSISSEHHCTAADNQELCLQSEQGASSPSSI